MKRGTITRILFIGLNYLYLLVCTISFIMFSPIKFPHLENRNYKNNVESVVTGSIELLGFFLRSCISLTLEEEDLLVSPSSNHFFVFSFCLKRGCFLRF